MSPLLWNDWACTSWDSLNKLSWHTICWLWSGRYLLCYEIKRALRYFNLSLMEIPLQSIIIHSIDCYDSLWFIDDTFHTNSIKMYCGIVDHGIYILCFPFNGSVIPSWSVLCLHSLTADIPYNKDMSC